MAYKVFDSSEKDQWYHYLEKIKHKDIYFTPEYCEIYQRNGEGKAQLFVYEDGDQFIYYPYLLRNLNELPHLKTICQKYGDLYDITTPYGYGGPITNVEDELKKEKLFNQFYKFFYSYCKENRIITEFVRFHPLIRNHKDYKGISSTCIRHTVYIDLTLDSEEIWSSYDGKNRNRIRKAEANDYFEFVHRSTEERDQFLHLYFKTMKKKNAYDYYYFDQDFFQNMVELLKGNLELIEVVMKDRVILSCFFMSYGDFVHYHLLGSDEEFKQYSPNNSLIHYAVKWSKSEGRKYLHLGGGYSGDTDTLYKFKKRFNKNGELPFYIGKRILNEEIYEELAQGLPATGDYFPLYREPERYVNEAISK